MLHLAAEDLDSSYRYLLLLLIALDLPIVGYAGQADAG